MNINSIIFLLIGSTFGLILRIFIQNNLKINMGFNIQTTSVVNFLASFFLGILVACDINNYNLLLIFYIGFLGCFSTFSSFIYQLFVLLQQKKYSLLISHYLVVMITSFICFYLGYFLIKTIKWK